jgi:hypothetical protein
MRVVHYPHGMFRRVWVLSLLSVAADCVHDTGGRRGGVMAEQRVYETRWQKFTCHLFCFETE